MATFFECLDAFLEVVPIIEKLFDEEPKEILKYEIDYSVPYHELFPVILEWEAGDVLDLSSPVLGERISEYKGCNEDGNLFFHDINKNVYYTMKTSKRYIPHNPHVESRRTQNRIQESKEYNELLNNFREEVRKLNSSDIEKLQEFDERLL